MEFNSPAGHTPLDDQPDGLVGKPIDRVDGRLKVTGRAPYAAEYAGHGDCAYGYVVQAEIAKGRIVEIDASAAEAQPGVLTVLTHKNLSLRQGPRTGHGPLAGRKGLPQFADDRVDHYGQAVALVVAESFEQARSASRLIRPVYAKEPAAVDLEAMMDRGFAPPARDPDSLVGDFDGAFAAAAVQIDATYVTPYQSHAMMEPHATLAEWSGGKLTLHTSSQMISQQAGSVAATLQISKEDVRLVSRYVGGGFGGKLDMWADGILAALASHKLGGRRVKVVLTRQQVFGVTGHRPMTIQRLRLGADREGRLSAIGHDVWCDNNPNENFYEGAAMATRSLYAGPNRRTTHRLVALDIPAGCSMRAPGEAAGLLALECAMDELADRLDVDPVALRIRNEPTEHPERHTPYSSRQLIPCLQEGARRIGWDRRQAKPAQVRDGRWLVGLGVASATRNVYLHPSSCRLALNPDGTLTARMAMTDIGTGTYTIATQLAAQMLGLPMDKVTVLMGDTDFPAAAGSGGSFGANSACSALYDACETLRSRLAGMIGTDPAAVRFEDGRVVAGNVSKTLVQLAAGQVIEVDGEFQPGDLGVRFSQQAYGAHFAEVGIDMDTGEIRLRRMVGVFTAGRILNEKTARSQCIGGMIGGLGAALTEELVLDPRDGSFVNHDLAEYHVPAHADAVGIEVVFLPELDDKASPLKSKGIGELSICGAGAAVANAVYNACGVRIRDYPLTLDKVLAGLKPS